MERWTEDGKETANTFPQGAYDVHEVKTLSSFLV